MFRDRVFAIAFIIALLWHAGWFSVVTVVTPQNYRWNAKSGISFLGPILDKNMFDMLMADKPVLINTKYKIDPLPIKELIKRDVPKVKRKAPNQSLYTYSTENVKLKLPVTDRDRKRVPLLSELRIRVKVSSMPLSGSPGVSISGPASERALIYKPDKPILSFNIDTEKIKSYTLKLKFTLMNDGSVTRVEPVLSSGNPDVDLLGINYLQRWRFEPLPEEKQTWGIAELVFTEE